jgi:hypothetical protein
MMRIFFFIIGFFMLVYGISLIILYLNLITIGYNLSDYGNFIIRRPECYFSIVGLLIIFLTLMRGKRGK